LWTGAAKPAFNSAAEHIELEELGLPSLNVGHRSPLLASEGDTSASPASLAASRAAQLTTPPSASGLE
jgi:hypothetical protein